MIDRHALYSLSFACFAICTAPAQAHDDTSSDRVLPTFTRAQIHAARNDGVDLGKVDPTPGLHIVPLSKSWSTAEHADMEHQRIEQQRSQGFYSANLGEVTDARASIRATANAQGFVPRHDRAFHSLSEVRQDILVEPIGLGSSGLSPANLLELRLAGSHVQGKWTGLSRSFDIPELGLVILNETDHVAGKESVTLIEEWMNIEIHGRAGSARTARDASGRTLVTVGWADQRKLYSLQLQPLRPEAHVENQARLVDMARRLVDNPSI